MLRADRHADALYREVSAFHDRKAAHIAHHVEPQTGDHVFWMNLTEEPSLREWGLTVGDVLHNLHSALDCVAWKLAYVHLRREPTEDEAHAIHFPIRPNPDSFGSDRALVYFTETHRTMLSRVQPYQRGFECLRTLWALSNRDKHRVIQPTYLLHEDFKVTATPVRDCEVVKIIRAAPGPFEHARELARAQITRTGPEPETEGHAKLRGYIALSDGTRLQHLLDDIGRVVRQVIRDFEPTVSGHLL
jgi:hypothetical protein